MNLKIFITSFFFISAHAEVRVYFMGRNITDRHIFTSKDVKNLILADSDYFHSKLRTFVYIPGLGQPFTDEGSQTMIKSLLKLWDNSNVLFVDWSSCPTDAFGVKNMFKEADIILKELIKSNLRTERLHVIAFGLGSFVAGYIGKFFNNASLPIARITGLNPHNLANAPFLAPYEIKRTDARFVDIIHADEVFGMPTTNGHVDYWPNGGKDQPGCYGAALCDHFRAWMYFAESIELRPKSYKFIANECPPGVKVFNATYCNLKSQSSMGFFSDITTDNRDDKLTVNYYLSTNTTFPFSKN